MASAGNASNAENGSLSQEKNHLALMPHRQHVDAGESLGAAYESARYEACQRTQCDTPLAGRMAGNQHSGA